MYAASYYSCFRWLLDETDSGFDLGHSRSPTEVDDNSKSFSEHTKLESRSSSNSHASENGGSKYTPLFKKKRQTPPTRRSTGGSQRTSNEYNSALLGRHESSDEELSSRLEQISVQSK